MGLLLLVGCGAGDLVSGPGSRNSSANPPAADEPTLSPSDLPSAEAGSSLYTLQALSCSDNNITGVIPAYANANLTAAVTSVQRAIVVLHDATRDAEFQIQSVVSALAKAGGDVSARTTLIVAPWYVASSAGLPPSFPTQSLLSWSDNGYMSGYDATGGGAVSSFAAIDHLLTRFADKTAFPALRGVFVIGHSAGGQTAQRYAVIGRGPRHWRSTNPVLRFAIANPSSYVYFTATRPNTDGAFDAFDARSCPTFDEWKFGMLAMPPYFRGESTKTLAQEYLSRDVTYALGTADNNADDDTMDRSCCAEAEGSTRLVRGRNYINYLKTLSLPDQHTLCEVPGVGHDTGAMLNSNCLLQVLRR